MYETNVSSLTYNYPAAKEAAPTPNVTMALRELSEAAANLAIVSEDALAARARLLEAQERYAKCADVVAKEREQAGV